MPEFQNIEAEYIHHKDNDRRDKLETAREFVALTIPSLLPEDGYFGFETYEFPEPYDSLPGRGATRLASKIAASLIPLNNIPFFSLTMDDPDLEDQIPDEEENEDNEKLRALERAIHEKIWSSNARAALYQAMLNLIIVGDYCLHQKDDFNFSGFPLTQFVVNRDHEGEVRCAIILEYMDSSILAPDLKNINDGQRKTSLALGSTYENIEPHYTKLEWNFDTGVWDVTKEFRQVQYDTGKTFKVLPYYFPQWDRVGIENYGRSLVEENLGAIRSLQGYSEAFLKLTAAVSKVLPFCSPTGITNIKDLQEAEDLEWVSARPDDIGFLQLNALPQMQEIYQALKDKQTEIKEVFLMNTATSLTGERVTATQIRAAIEELEQALGGVFSTLVREIQIPIVLRALAVMQKNGELSTDLLQILGTNNVNINIKTGLDAIGREMEGAKLQAILTAFAPIPEMAQVLNLPEVARRLITSVGIDPKGIVKSRDQMAQEAQAAQQAQMQQQISDTAIKTMGDMAKNGMMNA